ncbi:hypothetical protein [Undibacterium luofuense]|uniref:hypothetical protein n=1 Tax=Undibacterium luofuense TaxID=2828733 RepID=UPI0030EB3D73
MNKKGFLLFTRNKAVRQQYRVHCCIRQRKGLQNGAFLRKRTTKTKKILHEKQKAAEAAFDAALVCVSP